MARTALTKTPLPGSALTALSAVTFAAADVGNGNLVALAPGDILIAWNSGAGSHTVTVTSVADSRGRTGDITTQTITAGQHLVIGAFDNLDGWRQTDGNLYVSANHAEVQFGILSRN